MIRKIQREQIRNLLDAVVYGISMQKHQISGQIFTVPGLNVHLQRLIELGVLLCVVRLQLGQNRMQAMGQNTFVFQAVDQNIEGVVRKEKDSMLFSAPFCDGEHLQRLLVMAVQVAGPLKHIADAHQDLAVIGQLLQSLINLGRDAAGFADLKK